MEKKIKSDNERMHIDRISNKKTYDLTIKSMNIFYQLL